MVSKLDEHLFLARTTPIGRASALPGPQPQTQQPAPSRSFAEVLGEKEASLSTLKLSAHAQQRLQSRNITLSASDMDRISNAVDKASAKGGKDTLVVMKDLALVVSAQNRTIITAMDEKSMRENVFTQIDSAVVL